MHFIVNADFLPENTSFETHVSNNTVALADGSLMSLEKGEGHQNLYYAVISNQSGEVERIPVIARVNSRGSVEISMRGYIYQFSVSDGTNAKFLAMLRSSDANKNAVMKVSAPMPGLIKQIFVKENQAVKKGENLFVLEAMKMENIIKAPAAGVVHNIVAEAGIAVDKGDTICVIGGH